MINIQDNIDWDLGQVSLSSSSPLMAFVSNTKVGRSAMLASLDETEPCECLETKIHGSRAGIQKCNLQVPGLKATGSTSKAITFCSILLSWDVVGYAFWKQGPTLSISRFFEGRIIFFTNHSSLCRRYPPQGYHRQIHWKESPRNVNNSYFNFFEVGIKVYLSKGLLQFPQVKQALWYTLTILTSLGWWMKSSQMFLPSFVSFASKEGHLQ